VGDALADQDRTLSVQSAPRFGVLRRHPIGMNARAPRRRHTGGVDQVLERNRDAVQWAFAGAARDLLLGLAGVGERLLGQQGGIGAHARLEVLDAAEQIADELNGRQFTRRDQINSGDDVKRSLRHVRRGRQLRPAA
jgi:hypothetical protein